MHRIDLRAALTVGAVVLALPGMPLASVSAQASSSTSLSSGLPSCGNPVQVGSSGTPTSNASINSHAGPDCSLRASGYAYLGVVGASATANYNTGDWRSAGVGASASGSWNDNVVPTWNSRFSVEGASTFRLFFNVGATGSASASSNSAATGSDAGGTAAISYEFRFGGFSTGGTQSASSSGAQSIIGPWGTISGSVDLSATVAGGGTYVFSPFGISLLGAASAVAGRVTYTPISPAVANANADFGSTLIWGGIVGVQAFDAFGSLIPLPDDFQLGLSSQLTSGDYWNAAIREGSDPTPPDSPPSIAVPEPSSTALMILSLLALAAVLPRRRAI